MMLKELLVAGATQLEIKSSVQKILSLWKPKYI